MRIQSFETSPLLEPLVATILDSLFLNDAIELYKHSPGTAGQCTIRPFRSLNSLIVYTFRALSPITFLNLRLSHAVDANVSP